MKIRLGDGNTAGCFEGQRLTHARAIAAHTDAMAAVPGSPPTPPDQAAPLHP